MKNTKIEFGTKRFIREVEKEEHKGLIQFIKRVMTFKKDNIEDGYMPIDSTVVYSAEGINIECEERREEISINIKDITKFEYCNQISCLIIKSWQNSETKEEIENIIYLPEEEKERMLHIIALGFEAYTKSA